MKEQKQIKPNRIYDELRERRRNLENIISKAERDLQTAPIGSLHTVSRNNGANFQYYLRNAKAPHKEIYLNKSDTGLISRLARKKYDIRVLSAAQKELDAINYYLKHSDHDGIIEAYEKTVAGERGYITPYICDNASYVRQWSGIQYEGKKFSDDSPEFYTEKGERVRSKSEVLIANTLNKHNIPYKYEFPLQLSNGLTVYPDFTVLNADLRQVVFWEHLGMMDDIEYVRKAMKKIDGYEATGIYPGKKLIITHETSLRPLSSRMIENTIAMFLER